MRWAIDSESSIAAGGRNGSERAFSLLGGPLHRLGSRLGLVRRHHDSLRLGIALAVLLWVVNVALLLADGQVVFAVAVIDMHVRLLVAIPLLFACEATLDPRLDDFVSGLARSGILRGDGLARLQAESARLRRWVDSRWPDALCLIMAFAATWMAIKAPLAGLGMQGLDPRQGGDGGLSDAGLLVTLAIFRFLVLRWVFRLALWIRCLWFISRLPLRLSGTHPDGMGGLGELEEAQAYFATLVMAITAVISASFAVDIALGRMALADTLPPILTLALTVVLLFAGPAVLFVRKLRACRHACLRRFSQTGAVFAQAFEHKWLADEAPSTKLLGHPDISSLADLQAGMRIVRAMRVVPMGTRTLLVLGIAIALPLMPLFLFKHPFDQLLAQLVSRLVGL